MIVRTKPDIHKQKHDRKKHLTLKANKKYPVIGLDFENFRIIDEIGEPILFPKYLFIVIDNSIPDDWKRDIQSDDEYYIDPPGLNKPGFYEDWHDGKAYAKKRLRKYIIENNIMSAKEFDNRTKNNQL